MSVKGIAAGARGLHVISSKPVEQDGRPGETVPPASLGVITLCCAWLAGWAFTWLQVRGIKGPFVFPDELVYWHMAKAFRDWDIEATMYRYNPLMPIIASFVLRFVGPIAAYDAIRVLNTLLFASCVVPVSLVGTRFLDRTKALGVGLLTSVMPWVVLTPFTWAEPAYYALFCWAMYLFVRFVERRGIMDGLLLGSCLGLLYLAKQAGAIVMGAFLTVLLGDLVLRRKKPDLKLPSYFALCVAAVTWVALWTATRAKYSASDVIGYLDLYKFGLTVWTKGLLIGFCEELSYTVTATLLIPVVLFAYSLIRYRSLDRVQGMFVASFTCLFVGLHVLTGVTWYGMGGLVVGYGRYLAPLYPFLLIIALSTFIRHDVAKRTLLGLLAVTLTLGGLVAAFSPLKNVYIGGMVNSPEVMYLADLFFGGSLGWTAAQPSVRQASALAAALVAFGAAVLALKAWRPRRALAALALMSVSFAYTSHGARTNMIHIANILAAGSNDMRRVILYFRDHAIDPSAIAFDARLFDHAYPPREIDPAEMNRVFASAESSRTKAAFTALYRSAGDQLVIAEDASVEDLQEVAAHYKLTYGFQDTTGDLIRYWTDFKWFARVRVLSFGPERPAFSGTHIVSNQDLGYPKIAQRGPYRIYGVNPK